MTEKNNREIILQVILMTKNIKYSSREEQAMAEIGHTTIRPRLARLLTVVFLGLIGAAPLVQQVADIRAYQAGRRASPLPQCYDIFRKPSGVAEALTRQRQSLFRRIVAANNSLMCAMHAYENSLEDSSLAGRAIRPSVQYVLTRWLGAGNEKTYCGQGNWLFYRPDIDYVLNHGFLEKNIMARRAAAGSETSAAPHPDPRPAIFAFNAELASRGIKLILMPTPLKPVIHPEKFAAGFENFDRPVQNCDYQKFIRDMEEAGIPVFDVSRALVHDKKKNKRDQFLAGDTHWRPEAMEFCARLISGFIRENINLPTEPMIGYTAVKTNVIQRGDIIAMLRLPERAGKFGAERVAIRQIFEPDGTPWRPRKAADILVLGDSFCNIYSLEAMGWGGNAGLVEQLSYETQRPVDLIAVNDNGAWAARELLMRDLSRGDDRLAGKRAVVWQFAARELTEGDWKIISLKSAAKKSSFLTIPAGSKLTVTGEIRAMARVPRPGSVPYADHIVAVHLADITDRTNEYGQAFVYMFSMTNHVPAGMAGLKPGDRVNLRLRPWSEVSAAYERINRAELDDPDLLLQEPCWGEMAPIEKQQ